MAKRVINTKTGTARTTRTRLTVPVDVSVILCTRDRPQDVSRAVAQYARQDFVGTRELILVDGGVEASPQAAVDYASANGQYVRIDRDVPLGDALNAGCMVANGAILQKWDDDDLYATNFLTLSVERLNHVRAACGMWGAFLVVVDGVVRLVDNGIVAGGTLVVWKAAWQEVPFPPVASRVDAAMLDALRERYGQGAMALVMDVPDAYTWVRHGGNMSQSLATVWGTDQTVHVSLDDVLRMCPEWKGGETPVGKGGRS